MQHPMLRFLLLGLLLLASTGSGQGAERSYTDIHLGVFAGAKHYRDHNVGGTAPTVGAYFDLKLKWLPIALTAAYLGSDACPEAEVFGSDVIRGGSYVNNIWFEENDRRCDAPWPGPGQPAQYTNELDLGLRKRFYRKRWHPFVGGGIALIRSVLDRDFATGPSDLVGSGGKGPWLSTGIVWHAWEHVGLGLEVKYSMAKTTVYGHPARLGGLHVGILLELFKGPGSAGRARD